MQTYSTIPAVEDAPLATPAKSETPTRKRVAIIAAICFASAVAGTAAPAAASAIVHKRGRYLRTYSMGRWVWVSACTCPHPCMAPGVAYLPTRPTSEFTENRRAKHANGPAVRGFLGSSFLRYYWATTRREG